MSNYSYSQVFQDRFALTLIGDNGFFLDIGCGWDHLGINSNTMLLEQHGWSGIGIDGDPTQFSRRKSFTTSNNTTLVLGMLPEVDLPNVLKSLNAPKVIDYLSVDTDPSSMISLVCFPFDDYEFKVLTFEHDKYAGGEPQQIESYELLTSKGYHRLCTDVRVPESMGEGKYFEDWWINPKYFTEEFIKNNTFEKVLGSYIIENIKK